MRIGRTGKSDYAIAEDGYLSGLHFAVECDGTQCRIRDLGSSNGTFVNGSRITEQVVQEGDSVVAGGSTFRIHVDLLPSDHRRRDAEGEAPRRLPIPVAAKHATSEDAGYSPAETALLNALYASGEQVFAVVDASRDSRIPTFLDSSGEAYDALDASGRDARVRGGAASRFPPGACADQGRMGPRLGVLRNVQSRPGERPRRTSPAS